MNRFKRKINSHHRRKLVQISVVNARDLTPEHIGAWVAIQSANPALESPFFRPEFTMAVAQSAENIFIGILHDTGGNAAGFFPFELVRPGFGRNLEMCDHQGVIAPATLEWDARDLLRGCGLNVWEFDHLISGQQSFRRFHMHTADSPVMNLADGYDAYTALLSDDGKRQLTKVATSARKVERELGSLRFVLHTEDAAVMQKMHEWRARKYGALPARSHTALETLRAIKAEGFAGVLSALYAGDTLIAVHFGIRSRTVWHWWFPTYNPELPSRYAPGMLLLLNMARSAPGLGAQTIDLGKGVADYKVKFRTGALTVASGSVDVPVLANLPRIVRRNTLNFIRNTPALVYLARRAKKIFKPQPSAD